jgi:hypothetical protein
VPSAVFETDQPVDLATVVAGALSTIGTLARSAIARTLPGTEHESGFAHLWHRNFGLRSHGLELTASPKPQVRRQLFSEIRPDPAARRARPQAA